VPGCLQRRGRETFRYQSVTRYSRRWIGRKTIAIRDRARKNHSFVDRTEGGGRTGLRDSGKQGKDEVNQWMNRREKGGDEEGGRDRVGSYRVFMCMRLR
jgi:hypothetical protein